MLRKRAQSHPRNQPINPSTMSNSISDSYFQSDVSSQNHKGTSFLKVPGLFVGFNPGSSEFDLVRSPTSTLDFRIFSSFGNPFRVTRAPQNEGHSKRWDFAKVGLSIVDSLYDETKESGKVIRSSDGKNVVFGQRMSVRTSNICSHVDYVDVPNSLPANLPVFRNIKPVGARKSNSNVLFEIGEGEDGPELYKNFRACSLDSGRYGSHMMDIGNKLSLGSGNLVLRNMDNPMPLNSGNSYGASPNSVPPSTFVGNSFIGSIPTSDIELSEDYTCVTTHGPNPKVTHIFCDRILECHNDQILKSEDDNDNIIHDAGVAVDVWDSYPSSDFLKFCYFCKKKLDGEDIYMYRGEKGFCSYSCRSQEIEREEEMETEAKSDTSEISDDKSSSSLFIAV